MNANSYGAVVGTSGKSSSKWRQFLDTGKFT